jgi:hypothetical protein
VSVQCGLVNSAETLNNLFVARILYISVIASIFEGLNEEILVVFDCL